LRWERKKTRFMLTRGETIPFRKENHHSPPKNKTQKPKKRDEREKRPAKKKGEGRVPVYHMLTFGRGKKKRRIRGGESLFLR